MKRPFSDRKSKFEGTNQVDLLIVGLGNPGDRYRGTRHNVGAAVVELLAERAGERLRPSKSSCMETPARISGKRVLLAVPTTFMNESGRAVSALLRRFPVDPAQLVIVHDELDLEEGRLKIKLGGGLAGHNGLRSIVEHISTPDFARVRIGIGKPPGGKDRGAAHVLSPVRGESKEVLNIAVQRAADAAEGIVGAGIEDAMRTWNGSGGG